MTSSTRGPDEAEGAGAAAPAAAALTALRYPREAALAERLRTDASMTSALQRADLIRRRSSARSRLLASAVQVSTVTVPALAGTIHRLREVIADDRPIEAFVYPGSEINAFLIEVATHRLLGFSSAAVEHLSPDELTFVAGHELGHAVFGHAQLPAGLAVDEGIVTGPVARVARGWQRAAEISADRVGVSCVGSVEVAMGALFRSLSGLRHAGPQLTDELLRQWDDFCTAVLSHGSGEQWELTHPHPLLRLRAAWLFGRHGNSPECNDEVGRMLAFMDPTLVEHDADVGTGRPTGHVDPYLAAFVFWGGVHVLGPVRLLDAAIRDRLRRLRPPGVAIDTELADPGRACANALNNMRQVKAKRTQKLSSQDLMRVLDDVLAVAGASFQEPDGRRRFTEAAEVIGIGSAAAELIIERNYKETT